MEAGYDYSLMGGRSRQNAKFVPALVVTALACVMLLSGMAYYAFGSDAQADQAPAYVAANQAGAAADPTGTGESSGAVKYTRTLAPASAEVIAGQQLYPGGFSEAQYWVNPLGYE